MRAAPVSARQGEVPTLCGARRTNCAALASSWRLVKSRKDRGQGLLLVQQWTTGAAPITSDFDPMYGPAVRCKRFRRSGSTVSHQCIRPLIGGCAPGHHGYQRACVLISGQASTGPFGSPVFACTGKTDSPSSSHPLADLGG
jgi:hypothetical protein